MLKDRNCFNQVLMNSGWVRGILNDALAPACLDVNMLDGFINMILSNHKIRLDKDVTFHESFRVGDSVIDFERNYVNIDANKSIFEQTATIIDVFYNNGKISIEGKLDKLVVTIMDNLHKSEQVYEIVYDRKNNKIFLQEKLFATELADEIMSCSSK